MLAKVRWAIVLETVHAQETREIGVEAVVSVRLRHELLRCFQRVLRQQSGQPAGEPRPWLPGSDGPDAQLPKQTPSRVHRELFFTSVHLAEVLLQAGLCGTTRGTRRDFPNALANAKLRAGESVKWTNEAGVVILKLHDKRDICLLATNDAGGDHVVQVRRKRQQVDLSNPTYVHAYNKLMGGVDHMDQLRTYYGVGPAGRRW